MNKNDMNLLLRYREIHKERSNQNSPTRIYFIVVIAATLILGAYSLTLWLKQSSLENQVKDLTYYVNSSEVISKLKEVEQLKLNNQTLDTIIEQTRSINDVFDSAVIFDSEALTVLQDSRYKGISFENVSYANGIIYLDISGTKPSDISNYVLRLTRENYFKSVKYAGYTYIEEDLSYRSTIMCTMYGGNLE